MKRPIITLDNGIEVLETTGDVDALAHGGGILYREPRFHEIYWTFWEERRRGQKNFDVFTAPIPEDVVEYFDPDLKEMNLASGFEPRDVRRLGRSKNPSERLQIVMAMRHCFGASRVDPAHSPESVDPFEMANRWGPVFGIDSGAIPMIEYEDYLVRETPHGSYECGSVDGTYLGRFDEFKTALCAVADHIKKSGRYESRLFHEHEFAKIELVKWDRETFIGKLPRRRGKLPEAPWRNLMKRYIRAESRKKSIDNRLKSHKDVTRQRVRKQTKNAQRTRIERARSIRKEVDEKYR